MLKSSWSVFKKSSENNRENTAGHNATHLSFKKVIQFLFSTKGLNIIMRISHSMRWTWGLYLFVLTMILLSAHALTGLILLFLFINGLLWPPIANIFVKCGKDPLRNERIIMSLEICFAFFWMGVLQISIIPSFILINILLINYSCYYSFKKFIFFVPLAGVFLFLGLWTQGFNYNLIYPIYYDFFIFALWIVYVVLVFSVTKSFFKNISSAQDRNTKLFRSQETFSHDFQMNYQSMNLSLLFEKAKSELDKSMGITSILYYSQSESERFILSEAALNEVSKEFYEQLENQSFSYLERHDIFSKSYQRDNFYFQFFDHQEGWLNPFYSVNNMLSSKFLILYPVIREKEWRGLVVFASTDTALMKNELKMNILSLVAASLSLAIGNKRLFYEEESFLLHKRSSKKERADILKSAARFLPDASFEEIEAMVFSNDKTNMRKRILTLIVDMHSLIHLSSRENQYGKPFYEFIFRKFQQIVHNHQGYISVLSVDRLVAYWDELEGGFKESASHALSSAKEFREIYNDYVKKEFLSHGGAVFLRFGLCLNYVTFAAFGNNRHQEYTFYSHENEMMLKKLKEINPNAILCDEATHLILKNEVLFNQGVEGGDKFFSVNGDEKEYKFEADSTRFFFAKKEKKSVYWQRFFERLKSKLPQKKENESWLKAILKYLFLVYTRDPASNVTQYFRWVATPCILIIGAMLYYQGALNIFFGSLLFAHAFLWPIVTNIIVQFSDSPGRTERKLMLVESSWMGFWVGVLGLPGVPLLLIYLSFLSNNTLMSGVRVFPWYSLYFAIALLLGFTSVGFQRGAEYPEILNEMMLANYIFFMAILVFAGNLISKSIESVYHLQKINVDSLSAVFSQIDSVLKKEHFSEKIVVLGEFLESKFNMPHLLFYEVKDRYKCELAAFFSKDLDKSNEEAIKKVSLAIKGEKSFFNGTYQLGGLYFYLSDNKDKFPNHCLNEIHHYLQKKIYIIFPLLKKGELVAVLIFTSDDVAFMKKKVKSTDLEYLGYHILLALDKAQYRENDGKVRHEKETKEVELESIEKNLSFYLSPSVFQRLMKKNENGFDENTRLRVTTVYMDFTHLLRLKSVSEGILSMLYHGLFKSVTGFAEDHGGELESFSAHSAVVYWVESSNTSIKELSQSLLTEIQRFRQMYKELLNSFKILDDDAHPPLRIGIRTHYVTAGFLGNAKYKEYSLISHMGEAFNHALLKAPEGSVLCDESVYLLTKDILTLEQITGEHEEKNKLFLVILDKSDKALLSKAREAFAPVVAEKWSFELLNKVISEVISSKLPDGHGKA